MNGGNWFYGRDGKRLELLEWAKLLEDLEYKRVASGHLLDGTWISTVWIGLDRTLGFGRPVIFETMVFKDGDVLDSDEYSTEAEAVRGHKKMVMKWRSRKAMND